MVGIFDALNPARLHDFLALQPPVSVPAPVAPVQVGSQPVSAPIPIPAPNTCAAAPPATPRVAPERVRQCATSGPSQVYGDPSAVAVPYEIEGHIRLERLALPDLPPIYRSSCNAPLFFEEETPKFKCDNFHVRIFIEEGHGHRRVFFQYFGLDGLPTSPLLEQPNVITVDKARPQAGASSARVGISARYVMLIYTVLLAFIFTSSEFRRFTDYIWHYLSPVMIPFLATLGGYMDQYLWPFVATLSDKGLAFEMWIRSTRFGLWALSYSPMWLSHWPIMGFFTPLVFLFAPLHRYADLPAFQDGMWALLTLPVGIASYTWGQLFGLPNIDPGCNCGQCNSILPLCQCTNLLCPQRHAMSAPRKKLHRLLTFGSRVTSDTTLRFVGLLMSLYAVFAVVRYLRRPRAKAQSYPELKNLRNAPNEWEERQWEDGHSKRARKMEERARFDPNPDEVDFGNSRAAAKGLGDRQDEVEELLRERAAQLKTLKYAAQARNPGQDRIDQMARQLFEVQPQANLSIYAPMHVEFSRCFCVVTDQSGHRLVTGIRIDSHLAVPAHVLEAPILFGVFTNPDTGKTQRSRISSAWEKVGDDWAITPLPPFLNNMANSRSKIVSPLELGKLSKHSNGALIDDYSIRPAAALSVVKLKDESFLGPIYARAGEFQLGERSQLYKYQTSCVNGDCGAILVVWTAKGPLFAGSHRFGSDSSIFGYAVSFQVLIERFPRAQLQSTSAVGRPSSN